MTSPMKRIRAWIALLVLLPATVATLLLIARDVFSPLPMNAVLSWEGSEPVSVILPLAMEFKKNPERLTLTATLEHHKFDLTEYIATVGGCIEQFNVNGHSAIQAMGKGCRRYVSSDLTNLLVDGENHVELVFTPVLTGTVMVVIRPSLFFMGN